ncbi:MAG: hypothetical protein GY804_02575 [Alphaproteobacteria bacterium]|nr:hypothetical protein [Alphaproteobacteria bacterium]
MNKYIQDIETLVLLALNVKPKNRTQTKMTRAETMKILSDMASDIQAKLLYYNCLEEVVEKSKDKEDIKKVTESLFIEAMEKVVRGEYE